MRNFFYGMANRSDLTRRLVLSVSWSLFGSIIGKGLMLFSFIIVARIIGKEQYGQLGIIRSTINMFLTFSTLGMGLTASRYIALHRNTDVEMTAQIIKLSNYVSLFFGLIIFVLLFIFSPYIAQSSFGNLELSLPLRLSAIALFFTTITSSQNGVLTGFEDFKTIGIVTVKQGVFQALLLILGAYYYGINGVVIALGLSAFFLFILYRRQIVQKFRQYISYSSVKLFDERIKDILIRFTLPAVLSSLVTLPVFWWTKTILVKNSGYGEMAIFDVSEQWNMMFQFIPISISAIMLPMLTNLLVEGTNEQYKKFIKLNLIVNVSFALFLALIFIPISPLVLKMYGKTFSNYLPFQIMLFVAVLQVANNILGQVIASKGKMWLGFMINVFWAIWMIIFTFVFVEIYKLGALGLSYALLVSYFLHSVTQAYLAFKIKI